jgi:hypothetical protein
MQSSFSRQAGALKQVLSRVQKDKVGRFRARWEQASLPGLQPVIVAKRSMSSSGIPSLDRFPGGQVIHFGEESS